MENEEEYLDWLATSVFGLPRGSNAYNGFMESRVKDNGNQIIS